MSAQNKCKTQWMCVSISKQCGLYHEEQHIRVCECVDGRIPDLGNRSNAITSHPIPQCFPFSSNIFFKYNSVKYDSNYVLIIEGLDILANIRKDLILILIF